MDKESNADGVWPRKEGWQSITNKEGSTASGALRTKRGAVPGDQCQGVNASGSIANKRGSNAKRALLAKGGAMPEEHC